MARRRRRSHGEEVEHEDVETEEGEEEEEGEHEEEEPDVTAAAAPAPNPDPPGHLDSTYDSKPMRDTPPRTVLVTQHGGLDPSVLRNDTPEAVADFFYAKTNARFAALPPADAANKRFLVDLLRAYKAHLQKGGAKHAAHAADDEPERTEEEPDA